MKFSTSSVFVLLSFTAFTNLGLVAADGTQYVNYGDLTYLQNYNMQSAWLNFNFDFPPLPVNDITKQANDYLGAQLIFVSQAGYGNPGADPMKGQCIKFGDQFSFYSPTWTSMPKYVAYASVATDDRFGLIGDVINSVMANGFTATAAQSTFTIRSTQGNGHLDQPINPDPLFGECVQQDSVVFLQSTLQDVLFLGYSTKVNPNTQMYNAQVGFISPSATSATTKGAILGQQITNPQWIITSTLSDGSTSYALACQGIPSASQGSWRPINGEYNGSVQKVTYTVGTTTQDSKTVTSTTGWKNSITGSVTVGFKFLGTQDKVTISATGEWSGSQASSVSQAVSQTSSQSLEEDFGQGQVWQFVYDTADVCVGGFDITTQELALTAGVYAPPCCLPGFFVDDSNPHGPCVVVNKVPSPCVCGDDICGNNTNSTLPPSRGLRGSMN